MPKIYLSPSTQEFNRTLSGRSEEYYMNLIADAIIPYLNASGIEYGRNMPNMTALEAAEDANKGDYDFYLAIHSNAAGENFAGMLRGADIYYYPNSIEGRRAATIFANNYKEIYPQPSRVQTIPLATLIDLNKTKMPAILVETAYHDNSFDFAWLSSNINEIAENLSISVADYLNVPFSDPARFGRGIVNLTSGNLNVRREPSINSQVIATLRDGETVTVLQAVNNWLRIRSNGITGYVDSRFINEL